MMTEFSTPACCLEQEGTNVSMSWIDGNAVHNQNKQKPRPAQVVQSCSSRRVWSP